MVALPPAPDDQTWRDQLGPALKDRESAGFAHPASYLFQNLPAARFAADLPPQVDAATFIGPRLVELCFQTVGLLEAGTDGVLALPLHVGAVRLAGRLGHEAVKHPTAGLPA